MPLESKVFLVVEQELCHLVKMFERHELAFPLLPKLKGSKKEQLLYLMIREPYRAKSFYKNFLYQNGYSGTAYEVLRGVLLEDLLLALALGDGVPISSFQNRNVKLIQQVQGLRLAIALPSGGINEFVGIIKRLIKKCQRASLWSEEIILIRWLIVNIGLKGSRSMLEKYERRLNHLRQLEEIRDLIKVNQAKLHLALGHQKDFSSSSILAQEDRINALAKGISFDSVPATMKFELLRQEMVILEAKKDFYGLLRCAQQGIEYAQIQEIPYPRIVAHMSIYKAFAYAGLKRYQEFYEYEAKAKALLASSPVGASALAEVSFSVRMLRCDFESVCNELHSICDTEFFRFLSSDRKDFYSVLFAYLGLAIDSGIWRTEGDLDVPKGLEDRRGQLKLRSNKLGVNIGLIVLKFCEELGHDNFEALISMDESLKRYISRNLKMHDTRPSVFLKMLLKVIQLDFNGAEIEKKTKRLYLKLQEPSPGVNTEGNEIIRYEVLWEWILKKLKESSLLPKPKSKL